MPRFVRLRVDLSTPRGQTLDLAADAPAAAALYAPSGELVIPPDAASQPLSELARGLVKGMLAAHQVHPRLHQILMDQVPRVGRLEKSRDLDARA